MAWLRILFQDWVALADMSVAKTIFTQTTEAASFFESGGIQVFGHELDLLSNLILFVPDPSIGPHDKCRFATIEFRTHLKEVYRRDGLVLCLFGLSLTLLSLVLSGTFGVIC